MNCAVGVRQEGDLAMARASMVSGELTAASAHRSKVHPTTTLPLQPLELLLLLLLMLVARAGPLSLFCNLGRPVRSSARCIPRSPCRPPCLVLSSSHTHTETHMHTLPFSFSFSRFCSLRLRQSTFVFSRYYSTDRLNVFTTREWRTHMSSVSLLACSHAGTGDVWKPGHACTRIPRDV